MYRNVIRCEKYQIKRNRTNFSRRKMQELVIDQVYLNSGEIR